MKLKQLINGGALAATVLTLGSAQAEKDPLESVVFCKATMHTATGNEKEDVSVTLSFKSTGAGDRQYAIWNLGDVACGGVADSWHGEGGPGKFVARNSGLVDAYVYLTSSHDNDYSQFWFSGKYGPERCNMMAVSDNDFERVFGGKAGTRAWPSASLEAYRRESDQYASLSYCLAFTSDVEARRPTWHMLNRCYSSDGRDEQGNSVYAWRENNHASVSQMRWIGAYMGRLTAGDSMPFDVKLWAPRQWPEGMPFYFTFKVEAASFPLWEHDLEVQ